MWVGGGGSGKLRRSRAPTHAGGYGRGCAGVVSFDVHAHPVGVGGTRGLGGRGGGGKLRRSRAPTHGWVDGKRQWTCGLGGGGAVSLDFHANQLTRVGGLMLMGGGG